MRTTFGILALVALAGSASAGIIDLPASHFMVPADAISAADLGSEETQGTVGYSSIPGPYSAFAAAAFAGKDDYVTNIAGAGNFTADKFRFVGGVTAVGGILDIFFLDAAGTGVISSFGVSLPSAGDFIWTITLNGVAGLPAAKAGQVQIQTRTPSLGRWFLTSTPAAPGTNSFASGYGSSNGLIAAFEFQELVPAPSSLALLGLGGLVVGRRRR